MENASKALIIAGSILLSILIIALGMYIFSTSSSTSDVEILNETEIQTFNAKFEKYKGSQLGSNVDALITALRSNYTSNSGSTDRLPQVLNYNSGGGLTEDTNHNNWKDKYVECLTQMSGSLQKSHKYTVTMEYNGQGLINKITIKY